MKVKRSHGVSDHSLHFTPYHWHQDDDDGYDADIEEVYDDDDDVDNEVDDGASSNLKALLLPLV